jgi:hypothetical protein
VHSKSDTYQTLAETSGEMSSNLSSVSILLKESFVKCIESSLWELVDTFSLRFESQGRS